MKKLASAIVLSSILALMFGQCYAADTPWQKGWSCGHVANKPSRKLVQALNKSGNLFSYKINDVTLPILIAEQTAGVGALVFVQKAGQWQMYPVAEGNAIQGVFSTPAFDRFMLFGMWSIEGPGQEYTVLRGKRQFTAMDCTTIAFPSGLNQPAWANEFLQIEAFNMGKQGRGVLLGSVERQQAGKAVTQVYRYTSSDWGKTWGKPVQVKLPIKMPQGIFLAATATKPAPTLVNSLINSLPR